MREFLAKNKTAIIPQPPYSPADFFLFPKLKTPMKEKRFARIREIKEKSKQKPKTIPSAFQKCFEDWKKRLHKCIISEGGYFEGHNILIDTKINTFFFFESNGYFLIKILYIYLALPTSLSLLSTLSLITKNTIIIMESTRI